MLLRDIYRIANRLKTLPADEQGSIKEPFMHFEVGVRRSEIQSWLESQNPQYGRKEALLGQFLSVDRIENQARKNVLIAVAINKALHKKVIDTYGSLARQGEFETELDFVFRCMRIDFERGEDLSIFPDLSLSAWKKAEGQIALQTEMEHSSQLDEQREQKRRGDRARP